MGHLGDFGTQRPQHDATFGYFGTSIRVHPDLSDTAVVDLFTDMGDAADSDDITKALGALRSVSTVLVHPDDAEEFWRLVRANRQTMEDIASLAMQLLGALTGRPTQRPSDSSVGPSPTPPTSADDSSSRALRLLDGRPDLQVAVLRAQAVEAASEAASA